MKKDLENWLVYTDILAKEFAFHYFGEDAEVWWVAGNIGGVLFVNDRFFGMQDIADYIKYRYSKKDMFAHSDWDLEQRKKGLPILNIKNWRQLHDNKTGKKRTKKS